MSFGIGEIGEVGEGEVIEQPKKVAKVMKETKLMFKEARKSYTELTNLDDAFSDITDASGALSGALGSGGMSTIMSTLMGVITDGLSPAITILDGLLSTLSSGISVGLMDALTSLIADIPELSTFMLNLGTGIGVLIGESLSPFIGLITTLGETFDLTDAEGIALLVSMVKLSIAFNEIGNLPIYVLMAGLSATMETLGFDLGDATIGVDSLTTGITNFIEDIKILLLGDEEEYRATEEEREERRISEERFWAERGGRTVMGEAEELEAEVLRRLIATGIEPPTGTDLTAMLDLIRTQILSERQAIIDRERALYGGGYQRGTDFVQRTGPAIVDRGETISPQGQVAMQVSLLEKLVSLQEEQIKNQRFISNRSSTAYRG